MSSDDDSLAALRKEGKILYKRRMKILHSKLVECGAFDGVSVFPATSRFIPRQYIDIGWGSKNTDHVALFGNVISLSVLTTRPNYVFDTTPGSYYSALAFEVGDRQQPCRAGNYLLWERWNIHGDLRFTSGVDVVRWQTPLVAYVRGDTRRPTQTVKSNPTTVNDTTCRIFFVLALQSEGLKTVPETTPSSLISKSQIQGRHWNGPIATYCEAHQLTVIAVNCCRTHLEEMFCTEKIQRSLHDVVALDASGKNILYEMDQGVIVADYRKPEMDGKIVKNDSFSVH